MMYFNARSSRGVWNARIALPQLGSTREFGAIWIALAALLAVSAWLAPETIRSSALIAMSPFASFLAVVAVGQMLVIRQRGLDMSAGSMMALAGLVLAEVGARTGWTVGAVVVTISIAALVGCLNGMLVAHVSISPIVATLAVDALLLGAVRAISEGTAITMPPDFQQLTRATLLGLPAILLIAIVSVCLVALLVNRSLQGRRFIAVGASPRAAAASGLRVDVYLVGSYTAASVCFCLAGMLLAGFVGSASQTAGSDYLLPGIVAVIVGGTQFSGGRGSIVATAVAAVFMAQLQQLVMALGASPAVQLLVQAGAIVVAVGIRSLPRLLKP